MDENWFIYLYISLYTYVVMEMDGADGCTLWMYLISISYTLKMVKMASFMLCLLYHSKNWKKEYDHRIVHPIKCTEDLPCAGHWE